MDSSGSMRDDYQKEKDFVKMIAAAIGISENGSRVGVITFSGHAEHSIRMKGMGYGELKKYCFMPYTV